MSFPGVTKHPPGQIVILHAITFHPEDIDVTSVSIEFDFTQ